jgi:hypothetical protein
LVEHGLRVIKIDTEGFNNVDPDLMLSPVEHFGVFSENTEHDPWLGIPAASISLVYHHLSLFFDLFELNFCCLSVSKFQLLNGLLKVILFNLFCSDE